MRAFAFVVPNKEDDDSDDDKRCRDRADDDADQSACGQAAARGRRALVDDGEEIGVKAVVRREVDNGVIVEDELGADKGRCRLKRRENVRAGEVGSVDCDTLSD